MDWTQLTILVAEDSPTQALLIARDIEVKGASVQIAKDGKEALDFFLKKQPSLVISDITMPNMNGYELCKEIKNRSNIPVILLTVLSDTQEILKSIECKADCFITKPCPAHLLYTQIEELISNQNKIENNQNVVIDYFYKGESHQVSTNPVQMLNLLLSTYSAAIQKNKELTISNEKLFRAQEELKEKNSHLEKLNEEKNNFLGMAAHDLRNPLSVIMGFSGLLLDKLNGQIEEKTKVMLSHIKSSTQLMLGIINDLLDISSIESGKIHLNFSEENLIDVTQTNVTLNQQFASKKNINIVFEHDQDILKVHCDKNKYEQILNNLISNAIKYSNPNTTITLLLRKNGDFVDLSVKDQGQGIKKEEQEKLFHSFAKTSTKATAGETSTGLGLAIVKKIVTAHGGKIWVESEPDKGSTFFVELPINCAVAV